MYYVTSVYDKKAECFLQPQFYIGVGQASRNFAMQVRDKRPDNLLAQCPEDFTLFLLGTFDESCGTFTPVNEELDANPVSIMHGFEAVKREEVPPGRIAQAGHEDSAE